MLIKNTSNQNTPKVVGIGPYWIEPGQERMIPDSILYVDETDDFGNKTGKKIKTDEGEKQEKEKAKTGGKKGKRAAAAE